MLEPTHAEVCRAIEDVVVWAGEDYLYHRPDGKSCWYVWDGQPSCLVGRVLFRLGLSTDQLTVVENSGLRSASRWFRANEVIDLPERSVKGLVAAQIVQDGGNTWKKAIEAFYEQSK